MYMRIWDYSGLMCGHSVDISAFVPCHRYLHTVPRTRLDAVAAIIQQGHLPVDLDGPVPQAPPLGSDLGDSFWMQLPFSRQWHYWKNSGQRRHRFSTIWYVGLGLQSRNCDLLLWPYSPPQTRTAP